MLPKTVKDRIVKKYATKEGDTGSSEVQVALLTEEIKHLTKHLKSHKKDNSSRRGLLQMVNKRRKLLNYMQIKDEKGYLKLIKALKLKK